MGDDTSTLLVGDFNTHSCTWSPMGWTPFPWANSLEEWAAGTTLTLLTASGVVTRHGMVMQHQGDSVIDLVWHNFSSLARGTFHEALIDWPRSLGSDHALISTFALPQERVCGPSLITPMASTPPSLMMNGRLGTMSLQDPPLFFMVSCIPL